LTDNEQLSLYHEVRARGYEASIVATYNLSFHFYESVVLRQLQASGCRYNLLLADATQCARELTSSHSRPRFCGSDYALLAVRSPGAFHPKFILLLGRRRSRLIVGSHNVTLAGFGINREITTAFDVHPTGPSAAAAQEVWHFVRAWMSKSSNRLQELIVATERMAPWLAGTDGEAAHPRLFCSLPSGPSLWERVKPMLGQSVQRILIVSPYFDSKLAFIRTLERELNPKECVLAIHPRFTEMPADARSLTSRSRFVDVTQLGNGWAENRFHAKVYRFEMTGGGSVMVSGSANASEPAWLTGPEKRNAEIVVVNQDGEQDWERLGLARLSELPEVDQNGWESIQLRAENVEQQSDTCYGIPFVATTTSTGFLTDSSFTEGLSVGSTRVFAGEECVASLEKLETNGDESLCLCSDQSARESATHIEAVLSNGRRRVALVHHLDALLDRAAGNLRQAFRRALVGLEEDPDQLTELIRVVEKAIFDEPIQLEDTSQDAPGVRVRERTKSEAVAEPKSLMISAKDTVRARRRRSLSASSDLALIIDALIYRLGRGLRQEVDTLSSVRSPEDTFCEEDEPPPKVDGHALAKLCRRKVSRLFRRMTAQLELAAKRGEDATTPLIQLAAVLGVVKHLRVRQSSFEWLPFGEEMIDSDHKWEFFKKVVRLLYAPSCRLAAIALAEHGQQQFDELTVIRALLAWLALDSGLDTRDSIAHTFNEPELVREKLIRVAYFLPVMTDCSSDGFAAGVLADVTSEQQGDVVRAEYHLRWGQQLATKLGNYRPFESNVALGDIAFPLRVKEALPSVVVDVQPSKAGLLDLDTGQPRYYASGFLARVQELHT